VFDVANKLRTFIVNLIAEKYRNYPAKLLEVWWDIQSWFKSLKSLLSFKVHSLNLSLVM